MNYPFLILLFVLAVGFLWIFSRPSTIEDSNAKGRYIIVNTFTGNPCYRGRTFRTLKSVMRAKRKLGYLTRSFPDIFEIRKVL